MAKQVTPIGETARWGREWQTAPDWESHTVLRAEAERIAAGYVGLLEMLRGPVAGLKGLGVGSGAGHLEAALAARGIDMVASEWNEDGLRLIQSQNPSLAMRLVDLMTFSEAEGFDLIVCRELYPFTRTNEFSQQLEMLFRLVDGLKPNGILLLVGSDVSKPQCLDYVEAMRRRRADPRIAEVFGPVLEPLVKRMPGKSPGRVTIRLLAWIAELALTAARVLRRGPLAGIRVYAIRKAMTR